ncbi:MAG TPA: hypothetical protein PLJ21_04705, partial [Pseudobdellovibrionaceae bacterium]|nr:hypothetical protein [Pseudobdellovibrionaceae bacterium]
MVSENNHYHHQLKSNQRGQALTEYILVVVVTVAILIGLASQVFTPLQKFLQGYMGSYVECLLETGELPATLGGDYESAATSECRAKLDASLDILKGDGGSGSNGQGKSNKSSQDSGEGSESDSSKQSKNSSGDMGSDENSGQGSGRFTNGGGNSRSRRGG